MEQLGITIQGRQFSPDIGLIEPLLTDHPAWGRSRLSVELCELWDWRAPNGQLKDMACRNWLLRLERAGHLTLPPRQRKSPNAYRNRSAVWVAHPTEALAGGLKHLTPLQIGVVVNGSEQDRLFRYLLSGYHYLGFKNTVGENLKYLVHSRDGRPLACLLFAAAAWKCAARDAFIGWRAPVRERNLQAVANNSRFLVQPWVQVPYWPVICCRALRDASRPIGGRSMATASIVWRPSWIAAAIAACAIGPPIGIGSVRARDAAAMTAIIA